MHYGLGPLYFRNVDVSTGEKVKHCTRFSTADFYSRVLGHNRLPLTGILNLLKSQKKGMWIPKKYH